MGFFAAPIALESCEDSRWSYMYGGKWRCAHDVQHFTLPCKHFWLTGGQSLAMKKVLGGLD